MMANSVRGIENGMGGWRGSRAKGLMKFDERERWLWRSNSGDTWWAVNGLERAGLDVLIDDDWLIYHWMHMVQTLFYFSIKIFPLAFRLNEKEKMSNSKVLADDGGRTSKASRKEREPEVASCNVR
jgi:hypothetical protein